MELIAEILVTFFLIVSGVFGLVGSYGLLKLPDPMTRLHAPTKATTLGVGGVILASVLWFAVFTDHFTLHELLISIFLFLTAPVTGLMIAKANIHRRWQAEDLPDPGNGESWATFEDKGQNDKLRDTNEPVEA